MTKLSFFKALAAVPPSPCVSGYCIAQKIKACQRTHKKGCFAFYEYLEHPKGHYSIDMVGRMRKGSY